MRHAFIILAYNELELLKKLIARLAEISCDLYLNIDGKMKISESDDLYFKKHSAIRYYQRNKVSWGGYSILQTEMRLLAFAQNEGRADYFHILSGQDYPVKPMRLFLRYFECREKKCFLNCIKASYEKVSDRMLFYKPYDIIQARTLWGDKILDLLKKVQWHLPIERNLSSVPNEVWLGSQWCSLTKAACSFILEYTKKNSKFYRRLKHTFAPEEVYFPTILINDFKDEKLEIKNNLRFIRWVEENGNIPANLGVEHFKFLANKKYFFARKMSMPISSQLINLIDKYLLDGYEKYKKYFEYDNNIAETIVRVLRDIQITSVLVVGERLLYTDALLGSSFLVNSLIFSEQTLDIAQLLGVADFCQLGSWEETMEMDEADCFECLILINFLSAAKEKVLWKISNLAGLTSKYILIVEECVRTSVGENLETIAKETLFSFDPTLNRLINARIHIEGSDFQIYLLKKKTYETAYNNIGHFGSYAKRLCSVFSKNDEIRGACI